MRTSPSLIFKDGRLDSCSTVPRPAPVLSLLLLAKPVRAYGLCGRLRVVVSLRRVHLKGVAELAALLSLLAHVRVRPAVLGPLPRRGHLAQVQVRVRALCRWALCVHSGGRVARVEALAASVLQSWEAGAARKV